jgi:hypothetical protein
MHDPLDLGCQRLEGVAHLLDEFVPGIALYRVTQRGCTEERVLTEI